MYWAPSVFCSKPEGRRGWSYPERCPRGGIEPPTRGFSVRLIPVAARHSLPHSAPLRSYHDDLIDPHAPHIVATCHAQPHRFWSPRCYPPPLWLPRKFSVCSSGPLLYSIAEVRVNRESGFHLCDPSLQLRRVRAGLS